MQVSLTTKQVDAIHIRLSAAATEVQVRRWDTTGSRAVEVSQFERTRLIETVKIEPGGKVTIL